MITKELALTLRVGQELWHNTLVRGDGKPIRARVTGKCKTWKRTPAVWKLPLKHGLNLSFYIGASSDDGRVPWNGEGLPNNWSLPERWAIERHWKD